MGLQETARRRLLVLKRQPPCSVFPSISKTVDLDQMSTQPDRPEASGCVEAALLQVHDRVIEEERGPYSVRVMTPPRLAPGFTNPTLVFRVLSPKGLVVGFEWKTLRQPER